MVYLVSVPLWVALFETTFALLVSGFTRDLMNDLGPLQKELSVYGGSRLPHYVISL